jgi:hypothetical protein
MNQIALALEQAIDGIGQIAADRAHPQPIRVGSDAGNLYPARGQLQEE